MSLNENSFTVSDGELQEVIYTYKTKINNDNYSIDVVFDFENKLVYFSLYIHSSRGLILLKSDAVLFDDFEEDNPLLPYTLHAQGLSDDENGKISTLIMSKLLIDLRKLSSKYVGV